MHSLPRFAFAFACTLLLSGAVHAADWRIYDKTPGRVHEVDVDSVRTEEGRVYYTYRERWQPSIAGLERPIPAVADCVARKRSDVDPSGVYMLREVYAGTGQERQLEMACAVAGGPGPDAAGPQPSLMRPQSPRLLGAPTPAPAAPAAATAPPLLKVAFVYVGPVGDGGWTFSHDQGRQAMQAALADRRVEITWVTKVPEGAGAAPVLDQIAEQGITLVFTTAFGYQEPVLQAARKHPEMRFEQAQGYRTAANVRTYEIRAEEGAYLAGIIAGRTTRSNVIGVVAPIPIPETVRNINAFALGARSVNPKVVTRVAWVGEYFNPPKETGAVETLAKAGADVLLQNTDSSAVLATAERLGLHAFGWSSDMHAYGPHAHLGSVVLNWGPYYTKAVRDVLDGTWTTGRQKWGVAQDAVQLAALSDDVPEDAKQQVAAAVASLKAGRSFWRGPIVDQQGRTVVPAGSTLDDARMERMYFFVQGVRDPLPAH